MQRIAKNLKEEKSSIFMITRDCSDSEDTDKEVEQLQEKKGNSKNELTSNDGIETRPISPTVLLVLQNKIKCQHCEGGLKIKKHVKRTWSLVCENFECPFPRSQLESVEHQIDISEEAVIKNREHILKTCYE
uniref:Uncharacterized protein n=1 Tax=Clytia hemisphaerica TaxID=252671 RepID=A0A7M5WJM8_9CNID|eukprot:TCONS_00054664-protein